MWKTQTCSRLLFNFRQTTTPSLFLRREINTTEKKAIVVPHTFGQGSSKSNAKEIKEQNQQNRYVLADSPQLIEEITELRNKDPLKYSVGFLAKQYSVPKQSITYYCKLNDRNKEIVKSASIYKMNPSNNWKGQIHYRKIKTLQKERIEYDKQLEKIQLQEKKLEDHKKSSNIV